MLLLSSANFFLNSLVQTVKQFDPDQDRHSVGPGLGLNCLQRLMADDKSWR